MLRADIVFKPSSTALFVTIRSNGALPGVIYVRPVTEAHILTTPVISSFSDLSFVFSLNFLDSDSRILATNRHLDSPGAFFLDVSPSLGITQEKSITIPDQMAACWVAYALRFRQPSSSTPCSPISRLSALKLVISKVFFHFETSEFGAFDTAVDRTWLITLTDAPTDPKIVVFDLTGLNEGKLPQQVQSYDLFSSVGTFPDWMGLHIYPSS